MLCLVLLPRSCTTSQLSSRGTAQAHIITVSSRHLAGVAAAAASAAAAADAAAAACSAAAAVSDALGDGAQPFASRALRDALVQLCGGGRCEALKQQLRPAPPSRRLQLAASFPCRRLPRALSHFKRHIRQSPLLQHVCSLYSLRHTTPIPIIPQPSTPPLPFPPLYPNSYCNSRTVGLLLQAHALFSASPRVFRSNLPPPPLPHLNLCSKIAGIMHNMCDGSAAGRSLFSRPHVRPCKR